MELEHSFTIPVPPERAWQVLLDVEQVAPCLPGATVDSVAGDVVTGRIKFKVGSVALTYAGSARLTERDEQARSVTLEASGKQARGSGTASATVRSWLRDEDGQTRVTVHTTVSLTGRPAQFDQRMLTEAGGEIIEKFAASLAAQLADEPGLPIEELGLPLRAFNSLRREGIHTLGSLSARSEADLLAIAGLGPASVTDIKQKLAERGLALGPVGTAPVPRPPVPPAPVPPAPVRAAPILAAPVPEAGGPERGGPEPVVPEPVVPEPVVPEPVVPEAVGTGRDWAELLAAPPQSARPPDEDAIDLLSAAGFPVLKWALPIAGAVLVLLLVLFRGRRRRRRASTSGW